eukprot:GHRQ01038702.1.p2 GENE.GHRQ01038702.1~~GHRQ01038702.1.p2  ORF type:complete len:125 (+),score=14.99 GHRQ01038702.1:983-1357(+)
MLVQQLRRCFTTAGGSSDTTKCMDWLLAAHSTLMVLRHHAHATHRWQPESPTSAMAQAADCMPRPCQLATSVIARAAARQLLHGLGDSASMAAVGVKFPIRRTFDAYDKSSWLALCGCAPVVLL